MMPLALLKPSTDLDRPSRSLGLLSSSAGLNLENRVLAQAPEALSGPCLALALQHGCASPSWATEAGSPALQPTWLSSTAASSPLLSPQLLLSTPEHLISHARAPGLLSSSVLQASDETCVLQRPISSSSIHLALVAADSVVEKEEEEEGGGGGGGGEEVPVTNEDLKCTTEVCSGDPTEASTAKPVPEQEEDLPGLYEEDFGEVEEVNDQLEEELKDRKYLLLNAVCLSLVMKNTPPGEQDWDKKETLWTNMKGLAEYVSEQDAQFLLKVAVYTRQELNIRLTANFLLALAAHLPATKPHLRRYFCAAVQLPSDWLEVIRLYSKCFSQALPTCLKKALTDKFRQFTEYQLAKYNTRKQRSKHYRGKVAATQKPSSRKWESWAKYLKSKPVMLQKFMEAMEHKAVDKGASVFSLKKMIQRLHISEPAEHVMAILGKRYPKDAQEFILSGLKGSWDPDRAGQRMKLVQPDTWERMLSQEGNTANTWAKLIDSRALPFMAMLRNIRNLITSGISKKHHRKILARLINKESVVKSRQFPFRFLAAYKVVMDLCDSVKPRKNAVVLGSILNKMPRTKEFKQLDWQTATRKERRQALSVPFVYRVYRMRKKQPDLARRNSWTLLQQYLQALETAIQISCQHNVPLLPGRTLIFCSTDVSQQSKWQGGQDFCLPALQKSTEAEGEASSSVTAQQMAVLLALMLAHRSEDAQLYLGSYSGLKEVKLKSNVLLENVSHVMEQMELDQDDFVSTPNFFAEMKAQKTKVDTIICFDDVAPVCQSISKYVSQTDNDTLVVSMYLSKKPTVWTASQERNWISLHGFSEQILKFVAERGSSRLLDHVDHMDKLHNVPPPADGNDRVRRDPTLTPIPATPKLRWQGVRVFVSSTFRDMHSERDVLVRSVFPELRRRAAPYGLWVHEVDLRWGVTEEEASRAAELCLAEVCRSQLLLGILGERYGVVPPRPALPDLPQYHWLESSPPGLSITEMEIRQFEALHSDSAQARMLFYFRSPHISKSVPVAWRAEFAAESSEAESKMSDLKSRILSKGVKVTTDYPCEWAGVQDGKPHLKGLEEFERAVVEDLWQALLRLYVEVGQSGDVDEVAPMSEVTEQESYQEARQRQCHGRGKLVTAAIANVLEAQGRGGWGLVLVEGGPGDGKTVFMAALADALRTSQSKEGSECDVISYFTAAGLTASNVEQLLRCLIRCLRKRLGKHDEEASLPTTYKGLLTEFHSLLGTFDHAKSSQSLALLIDGADLVQDARGQLVSDWIPQCLPRGVSVVLSVTSNSVLRETLAKKKGTVLFPMGHLSLLDKKEIVQKELAVYGKKLSGAAFNNQLQTLLMKKGSISPLYLHLACEELRSFAVFEKMKESLQALPQSLSALARHCLSRMESQYRGVGLAWTMGALAVSSTGLREGDLYAILSMCSELSTGSEPVTWGRMLHLARKPQQHLPMAVFSQLFRTLQSVIGQSLCQGPDDRLKLSNPEIRLAFEDLFLSKEVDISKAHSLLAAHLWALSDPHGTDTFLYGDVDALAHLLRHLVGGGQWEALRSLLSNFDFLYASVRHGHLHPVLESYREFVLTRGGVDSDSEMTAESYEYSEFPAVVPGNLEACHDFLLRNAAILSRWPALFLQRALNEPAGGAPNVWAEGVLKRGRQQAGGGMRVMRWRNKPERLQREASHLLSTFLSKPTCVAVSPSAMVVAVGAAQGSLYILNPETAQELRSLVSSGDGISSCIFLDERLLGSTSFDGHIEIWDINSGCRVVHVDAHSHWITGSDVSADRKHFATVSLDLDLKVWTSQAGKLTATLTNPCPLNCVTFHPEGQLLAVGGWDGGVRLWNWLTGEIAATLSGHQQSVRSLCFSPSTAHLSSGSLSGEVRMWSLPSHACVGCYQAHRGSTEVLSFVEEGRMLLSGGADNMVQLWSGVLGRSLCQLGEEKTSSDRSTLSKSQALCVSAAGGYVAVGYHGDGLKLFSEESGEMLWSSENFSESVQCLVWIGTQKEAELLVTGGGDKIMRMWKRMEASLELQGSFGTQQGAVVAMAQSPSFLASASEDFTIALWSLEDLAENPSSPNLVSLLRGHQGGVTCLSFSPSGDKLLSGGKDQALLVWDVGSPHPTLSQSLLHCHGDWITGCAWTVDHVVSCSLDCRVRLWDLARGQSVREFLGSVSLTSVCSVGQFLMAASRGGELLLWNWKSGVEITRIPAHHSKIHQCGVLHSTDTGEGHEVKEEDLLIATASEDGTVKLWQPFQVQHHGTLTGHSRGVQGAAGMLDGAQAVLTVSEDCCLRSWALDIAAENPINKNGTVVGLCLSPCGRLVLLGFDTGRVALWHENTLLCRRRVTEHMLLAMTFTTEEKFAVSSLDGSVSVWRVDWNPQLSSARMCQVSTLQLDSPALSLYSSEVLVCICLNDNVHGVHGDETLEQFLPGWIHGSHVLCTKTNNVMSAWILTESSNTPGLSFLFFLASADSYTGSISNTDIDDEESSDAKADGAYISAGALDGGRGRASRLAGALDGGRGRASRLAGALDGGRGRASRSAGALDGGRGRASRSAGALDGGRGRASRPAGALDGGRGQASRSAGAFDGGRGRASRSAGVLDGGRGRASRPAGALDGGRGRASRSAGAFDGGRGRASRSAGALDGEFVVYGDSKGNIWFNMPPKLRCWTKKRRVHRGRVNTLKITDTTIISASSDCTVKLWDRQTKKQVGLFDCKSPVVSLEVNPCHPTELVCGDELGRLYWLSWGE
ncbi:telomerase protein component 1 [Brienomyrus brachyistius]|uniref:telomerase protein component 1 n=1 Tax=Brienomyrus brachyistius TaxID=42636 RepID=UPI0020B34FE4|nr:telomerase protein component 1 [Brienomyrus brachyistius]